MTAVTPATPEHAAPILALLEEMDRHYGATEVEAIEVRTRQLREALFAEPPAAYALLAWEGDDLVGIASYSWLWPAAGLTRSLYLKELYVTRSRWRSGVGSALMRAVLEVAAKHGASRVEWTTDEASADAQRFYEALGLRREPTKLFYRVSSADVGQQLR